jgi:hypothetical protein
MLGDLLKFSKKEKIALIGSVVLLVGYGIYQTAYGMKMGPNGTMVPGMPGASIGAPPGTNVTNIQVHHGLNGGLDIVANFSTPPQQANNTTASYTTASYTTASNTTPSTSTSSNINNTNNTTTNATSGNPISSIII